MDQQNPNTAPKPVPTAEEIARLEAEAAAAIQRGEAPNRPEPDARSVEPPAQPDFVPYVDDVVDVPAPKPEAEADADDEDDGEYIPGKWEVWVNNLSPKRWKQVEIAGGALVGLAALALLFIGSEELSTYRLILAALLALFLPRYLERVLRKELVIARRAMIVALLVGLAAVFLMIGARTGFHFTK